MTSEMSHPPAADRLSGTPLPQAVEALLRNGQPDWDAITFDVFCSRCEYNLKTLTRPRCPECGLEFDWQTVLDRAAWRSDFLFEHHWRSRPVRSWLETVRRSFRPARFWRDVSIYHRVEAGPLWFMLAFSAVCFLVVLHVTACLGWLIIDTIDGFLYQPPRSFGWRALRLTGEILHDIAESPLKSTLDYVLVPVIMSLILLATLVMLCSLRQTLGRCRVRSAQILRLTAYVATPVLILWSIWVIAVACLATLLPIDETNALVVLTILVCYTTPPAIFALFLGVGLKRYLQLPRAWLLAIVTVIVAFLFAFTVLTAFIASSDGA